MDRFKNGQATKARDLWTRAASKGNQSGAHNLQIFRVADAALAKPPRKFRNRRPI
ncbi:hypothetical protein ABTZ21_34300 [Streptomyces sp. NPDC096191]|uniref:hypothetical protein n=1 Tax=Streptomyces sp. NPDC096191 TaxID=3155426 RepID=UPI0033183863